MSSSRSPCPPKITVWSPTASHARDAFAAENRIRAELDLARFGDNAAQRECGTARRVNLRAMMDLDHLGVEGAQNLRHLGRDSHQHVDTDAHVGRDYGARARRDLPRLRFQIGSEAGRADYDSGALGRRYLKMLERRLRIGEIECDGVGTGEGGVIPAYRYTEVADPG